MVGITAFATDQFFEAMERSDATYRLTNSKGKFDFKYYANGWKGNQYVTTKNVSKVGEALNRMNNMYNYGQIAIAGYQTYNAFQKGQIVEGIEGINECIIAGLGLLPDVGPFVSLYWSVCGRELQQLYKEKIIMEQFKSGINPGLPTLQPYK